MNFQNQLLIDNYLQKNQILKVQILFYFILLFYSCFFKKKIELRKNLYALFSAFGTVLDVVALKTQRMRGKKLIVFLFF